MTTVLYIAGTGRSGSTVLAAILGEVEGVFAAGEVRYLWQRGLVEGRLCGCGVPVAECPLWSAVLATVEASGSTLPPAAMAGRSDAAAGFAICRGPSPAGDGDRAPAPARRPRRRPR